MYHCPVRIRVVGIIEECGGLCHEILVTLYGRTAWEGSTKARPRAIEKECKVSVSPSLVFILI